MSSIVMALDSGDLAVSASDPVSLRSALSEIGVTLPDGAVVAYLPAHHQPELARHGAQLVSRGVVGRTMVRARTHQR